MATDLVTIATTAILSQFLGPSAKHLGEQALEKGRQIGSKAVAYLSAVGREPKPVEPKLLLPLVQAASLETDETLTDLWAALLANAADPAQIHVIRSSHIEILKQLAPPEAQLLNGLFSIADKASAVKSGIERLLEKPQYRKQNAIRCLLHLSEVYAGKYPPLSLGKSAIDVGHRQEFAAMIDNFLRQQVIILQALPPEEADGGSSEGDRNWAKFTSLGYDFMLAVTPPTP